MIYILYHKHAVSIHNLKKMYNTEKRIFLNNSFQKLRSIAKVQRAYRTKYVCSSAPSGSVIKNIVSNYKKLVRSKENVVCRGKKQCEQKTS